MERKVREREERKWGGKSWKMGREGKFGPTLTKS